MPIGKVQLGLLNNAIAIQIKFGDINGHTAPVGNQLLTDNSAESVGIHWHNNKTICISTQIIWMISIG